MEAVGAVATNTVSQTAAASQTAPLQRCSRTDYRETVDAVAINAATQTAAASQTAPLSIHAVAQPATEAVDAVAINTVTEPWQPHRLPPSEQVAVKTKVAHLVTKTEAS